MANLNVQGQISSQGLTVSGGGRSVYVHHVRILTVTWGSSTIGALCTIITNTSTAFTVSTFVKWLKDNGFADSQGTKQNLMYKGISATGSGSSEYLQGLSADSNSEGIRFYYHQYGGNNTRVHAQSDLQLWDTVIQIL